MLLKIQHSQNKIRFDHRSPRIHEHASWHISSHEDLIAEEEVNSWDALQSGAQTDTHTLNNGNFGCEGRSRQRVGKARYRELRGISHIDPEDMEFKDTMKNAGKNLEFTACTPR